MSRSAVVAIVAAGTLGCGVIREVPVEIGTEGATDESSDGSATASTDGDTTHGPDATDDGPPDRDDAAPSSTGEPEDTEAPGNHVTLCATGSTAVPDDAQWLERAIEQPEPLRVVELDVSARVSHPRVADLRIELVAPDGVSTVLLVDTIACEGANISAVFNDAARWSVNDGCQQGIDAALDGMVAPSQPLSSLLEGPTAGTWLLRIQDVEAGNAGALESWCITLHEGA